MCNVHWFEIAVVGQSQRKFRFGNLGCRLEDVRRVSMYVVRTVPPVRGLYGMLLNMPSRLHDSLGKSSRDTRPAWRYWGDELKVNVG